MSEIVLMDGRARYSIDDALIISAGCSSLENAIKEAKEREDDCVVVDIDANEVLWWGIDALLTGVEQCP